MDLGSGLKPGKTRIWQKSLGSGPEPQKNPGLDPDQVRSLYSTVLNSLTQYRVDEHGANNDEFEDEEQSAEFADADVSQKALDNPHDQQDQHKPMGQCPVVA